MQGNTYKLRFTYRENGTVAYIPEGYDLVVGLYTPKGQLVLSGRLNHPSGSDIHIVPDSNDNYIYVLEVDHEKSVGLVGAYILEVTVVDDNLNEVNHATSLVTLDFALRRNNDML